MDVSRLIRGLLPLAIATLVVGAVTLWLLGDNPSIGRWVLAALLFAHGWVHLMFVFPKPDPAKVKPDATPWPFDLSTSWLITRGGVPAAAVGLGRALIVVTFAVSLLAALATLGWLVPAGWWVGLVVVAAGGSALLLMLCFSPTLIIGLAIDAALVLLALAGPWSPGAA